LFTRFTKYYSGDQVKEDGMSGEYTQTTEERDHPEELGVVEKIILE
jgi:hypothetical protein